MQNLIRASLFTLLQLESQLSTPTSRIFEHGRTFLPGAPIQNLGSPPSGSGSQFQQEILIIFRSSHYHREQ